MIPPRLAALILAGLAAILTGCAPSRAYLSADRATFDAVAPEYLGYVAGDLKLSDDQRARRTRTVQSWQARLEAAER